MKKFLLKSISLLCIISMLFGALISCQSNSSDTTEPISNSHTVKFNSNGGNDVPSIEIRHGQKMAEPTPPTRDNYIFLYWEHNNRKWHFNVQVVEEDITLSALWISANDLFKIEPCENENEILISGFINQKSVGILSIPEKINGKTVVGFTDNAFEAIHELHARTIIVPSTVRSIGKETFLSIDKVQIEFLGAVSSIDVSSFERCKTIKILKLNTGITTIPFRCFFGCEQLATSDIPEGVTIIEENAYSSCVAMQTVVLPTTLTTIEDSAFLDCSALVAVFFKGSEAQFDKIEIMKNNDALLDASIYFYSETEPEEKGDFWHYDKSGTPILW